MGFNTALSSPTLTKLRRLNWQGNCLLSFCDNVPAFAGQVVSNLNSLPGATTEAIAYNNVSAGAYTNVEDGMTIIISPNSDIRHPLAVRGRINYQGADATNIYVKEFSDPISAGAYFWVLYHFDILDILSRPVGTNPVIQYKDYNRNFERMAPVIVGLQTGYAGWVDGSGNLDIAFDASSTFAAESGRTITGFLYTVKATGSGSASVIAGSASTATVTYRFTAGEYWLKLVVTDSGSVTQFRHVLIKAHNRTNYLPQTGFDEVEITRDVQGGPSAHVKGYNGVSTLINGTMVIIWVDELYSDSDFSNPSTTPIFNNIDMVGWIEAEENNYQTDLKYSALIDVSFEVQGVGARLARLEGQLLAFSNNASPSTWDDINNLTPWRAIVHFLQRHTTVLNLCDFTSDDVTDTFLFPTIVTLAGRALDNLTGNQGIAEEINAQLEFAADGRIQLVRREPFVFSNLGHTPLTIATWASGQDFHTALKWKFRHDIQYGYLAGDGAYWDGSTAPVVPEIARAPGLAQASGADQGKLNNQILATTSDPTVAQAELSARSGTQYAMDNNTMELTCNHPAGYHWLQASYAQLYIWSLDSTYNIRGLTLDASTSWMIKNVTVRHNNKEGDREVSATYIPVRTGSPAAPIPVVNPSNDTLALPINPTIPAFPDIEFPEVTIPDVGLTAAQIIPTGTKTTLNGEILFAASTSKAYVLRQFITQQRPLVEDVTPSNLGSYAIQMVAISPFLSAAAIPAYILASDGTNSAVWYTPNVNAGLNNVQWTKGANVPGIYTVLRATGTSGNVFIYTPQENTTWTHVFDFTTSNGGWTTGSETGGPFGSYVAATGWQDTRSTVPPNGHAIDIHKYFSSTTMTSISVVINFSAIGNSAVFQLRYNYVAPDASTLLQSFTPGATGDSTFSWSGSRAFTDLVLNASRNADASFATIKSVTLSGNGLDPFGGSGSDNSAARLSTDNGLTFGTALVVGNSVGLTGSLDCQRAGTVSYAAALGIVSKATTLGGAYSSWYTVPSSANPVCIIIPYYRRNSTTKNTTVSDPDVIIGCDNGKWYWIDGTTATATDITPVASFVCSHPDALTVRYGNLIACWGTVSGTQKVYTSADGGGSWTLRSSITNAKKIRCRRDDSRSSPNGQIYLIQGSSTIDYSSKWFSNSLYPRTVPSNLITFDTVY